MTDRAADLPTAAENERPVRRRQPFFHSVAFRRGVVLVTLVLLWQLAADFTANPLLPLAYHDVKSGTPAAKSIPVLVRPEPPRLNPGS